MRVSPCVCAVSLLLLTQPAAAELRPFVGGGLGLITFEAFDSDDGSRFRETFDPRNMFLRFGASPGRYVEIGLEIGFTINRGRGEELDSEAEVETRLLYLQGKIPLWDPVTVLVRGGWARTHWKREFLRSRSFDDTVWGFGLQFRLRNDFRLSIDSTTYLDDDEENVEADAINIGVHRYFD